MNGIMSIQVCCLSECFSAYTTRMWPYITVSFHMTVHVTVICKRFITYFTEKFSLLWFSIVNGLFVKEWFALCREWYFAFSTVVTRFKLASFGRRRHYCNSSQTDCTASSFPWKISTFRGARRRWRPQIFFYPKWLTDVQRCDVNIDDTHFLRHQNTELYVRN